MISVFFSVSLRSFSKKEKEMKVQFMSLASGSSGNCYYLATDHTAILIDAGIGIRTIKKVFKDRMLNLEGIQGVLVTHDHADHIKAVGNILERH